MQKIMPFKIFVDADSCPREARGILEKTSVRLNIPLVYVANREIKFFEESDLFTLHVCPAEQDAADSYIEQNATKDDIVVTRDIPLAQRLVKKNITTLNDRGKIFDEQNVSEMLEERALKLQMQNLGIAQKNTFNTYGKKEKAAFARTLDKTLSAKITCLTK